ncbi:hypothetical protein F441_02391 [Phytophthora nicotianae CJ01A1]|uniref:Uncharacterized protein n=4 Tax=Phytophthora nicotianae TaxID=4792 RepID=W2QPL0_PHYN3|nr:hypothetical protein PPTG_22059 [Phytophthora nicotianae INRA-310]ETK94658.1 hypothetical protein L915_02325 [Phytophthora nicotianae]ETO83566.1 hypothetical protein F444_02427 [Phytophthora nicotianae P1976]ETP24637.1 hypothetical protein F441_02391 [Phytophthora nicotianae CJ01A1]ETL48057.1 hypothetical protein L916_02283 [Phytophthora nicotianae]ETM01153.1 hypothetical protein L917_02217 [Phytophthora nicotianae]
MTMITCHGEVDQARSSGGNALPSRCRASLLDKLAGARLQKIKAGLVKPGLAA